MRRDFEGRSDPQQERELRKSTPRMRVQGGPVHCEERDFREHPGFERWLKASIQQALEKGIGGALAPDRLLRRGEVEQFAGLRRSQILRLGRSGDFPDPVEITQGSGSQPWKLSEVLNWIESQSLRRLG